LAAAHNGDSTDNTRNTFREASNEVQLNWAQVTESTRISRGIQWLDCQVINPGNGMVTSVSALHYLDFGPACAPGQLVLLNMSVLGNNSGQGNLAFVIPAASADTTENSGRSIKLANIPLQRQLLAVDEPASPYHNLLVKAESLDWMPVVCCASHEQVRLVALAIKAFDSSARVVYCMTDQTGLNIRYSDDIAFCLENNLIDATISCGQAMGGDLEAVTLHSGLLAARLVAAADIVICSVGVGEFDTETSFGHLGIAQAEAINAVSALKGTPVAVLSFTESSTMQQPQPGSQPQAQSQTHSQTRRLEISQKSLIALGRVALAEALVALPDDISSTLLAAYRIRLAESGINHRHHVIELPSGLTQMALAVSWPTRADAPVSVKAAIAAGRLALIWAKSGFGDYAELKSEEVLAVSEVNYLQEFSVEEPVSATQQEYVELGYSELTEEPEEMAEPELLTEPTEPEDPKEPEELEQPEQPEQPEEPVYPEQSAEPEAPASTLPTDEPDTTESTAEPAPTTIETPDLSRQPQSLFDRISRAMKK